MTKTKQKRPLSLWAKICFAVVGAALLIVAAYQIFVTVRYRAYSGYKSELAAPYNYETDVMFSPLRDDNPVEEVKRFSLAGESDELKLYIDTALGDVAILDKRTGKIAYSNPPNAQNDAIANSVNKEALLSQLIIRYYDAKGKDAEFSSYKMSAQLNQIETRSISNGIRVIYTIGDTKPKAGIIPLFVTEERLDEILSAVEDERTRGLLKRRWEESDVRGSMQLIDAVINNPTQQKSLINQLEKIGYTNEDRINDEANSGVEGAENIGFIIPVEYRLEGDSISVTIPTGNIAEMGGGHIGSITLLPFFAAGGTEDVGYIVVPNGSGSLINFNNGRVNAEDYRQYVYGQDPLLAEYATLDKAETVRLPIFGIYQKGHGVLARIENGAPLAQITASVSGKLNSYNYVNAVFVLRGAMSVEMFSSGGSGNSIPVVEKPKAELGIAVRYTFLTDEYDGYAGMANYERERLIAEGVLSPIKESGDIPFFMDIIGSVQGRKFFLDIAYQGQITMTTYAQANEISKRMTDLGVTKQIVNYQGWFNRGYYHDVVDKIKPVGSLGSTRALTDIAKNLEKSGGKLYSDTLFQKVPFSSKRYNYVYETSKYYGGGMVASFGLISPLNYFNTASLGYPELLYDQLSPKFLGRYTNSFIKSFEKYGFTGVSLRDLGNSLASDRKRTEVISRSQAEEITRTNLSKLSGNYPLLINGGNFYSLSSADELVGVPLSHNDYYIVDSEIPFYEIIVSGCLDYAGEAANLSAGYDLDGLTLRLIEFGASPRFAFTYAPSGDMKYTALSTMSGTTFENWERSAAEMYRKVNSALSPVRGQSIVNHEILGEGVRRVTYEGGVSITINYNDMTFEEGGAK